MQVVGEAAEKVRAVLPEGMSMTQLALRWILMHDAVSLAIPVAKNRSHAVENAAAADLPPLNGEVMARLLQIYDEDNRPQVHQRW